jgi:hypothetical protein
VAYAGWGLKGDTMKIQEIHWKDRCYMVPYEAQLATEAPPEPRDVALCEMYMEIERLRAENGNLSNQVAFYQTKYSACNYIRMEQEIERLKFAVQEYEPTLIDIARGYIDYDLTELCREGMMQTAKSSLLTTHATENNNADD